MRKTLCSPASCGLPGKISACALYCTVYCSVERCRLWVRVTQPASTGCDNHWRVFHHLIRAFLLFLPCFWAFPTLDSYHHHLPRPDFSTMSGSSPLLGAGTAAHRVWSIAHIRLSVFEGLLSLLSDDDDSSTVGFDPEDPFDMEERAQLKQYLTLEQASFREVAFLLYVDIRLDQCPWNCPCEVSPSGWVGH